MNLWLALAPLVVFGAALVAIAGLVVVRRTEQFSRYFHENEVAGLLFSVMGLVYGALLAFVVFATWQSYAGAQQAVTDEAAAVVEAYRDTQTFPEPQRSSAQAALRTYVTEVVATEWASHGALKAHKKPDLLNPLWDTYRSIQPANALQESDLDAANDHLHALELQRHLRHLSGEAALPWIFWPLLLLGGVIVIIFSYFFHQTSLRGQALMTGVSAAMLAGVLVLIYSLNQPFTGPVPVSQRPFQHALLQFDAIDLPE